MAEPLAVPAAVAEPSGWLRSLSHRILQMTHGRSTAFFVMFFFAGHGMALLGKLTPTYVGFMGTLGGLILGHSIKEDWAANMNGPRPEGGPDAGDNKS